MDFLQVALGGVLALVAGYLGGIYSVRKQIDLQRRRKAEEREQERRMMLAGLLGELKDNLSLAQGEFRTASRNEPSIPAGFVTDTWEVCRGELMALGDAYEPVRAAYGVMYHANSVKDYVLNSLGKAFNRTVLEEYVQLHRRVLREKAIPALYDAIDAIEAHR